MEFSQAIEQIREFKTNGINCDIDTEDIVDKLIDWSKRFKFEVVEVDHATVALKLETLPDNLADFCREVYEFCPDVIDQGYDCIPDIIEMAEEDSEASDPVLVELIKDLDPESEDFGLKLMEKDLPNIMAITLWWD